MKKQVQSITYGYDVEEEQPYDQVGRQKEGGLFLRRRWSIGEGKDETVQAPRPQIPGKDISAQAMEHRGR